MRGFGYSAWVRGLHFAFGTIIYYFLGVGKLIFILISLEKTAKNGTKKTQSEIYGIM